MNPTPFGQLRLFFASLGIEIRSDPDKLADAIADAHKLTSNEYRVFMIAYSCVAGPMPLTGETHLAGGLRWVRGAHMRGAEWVDDLCRQRSPPNNTTIQHTPVSHANTPRPARRHPGLKGHRSGFTPLSYAKTRALHVLALLTIGPNMLQCVCRQVSAPPRGNPNPFRIPPLTVCVLVRATCRRARCW